MKKKYLGLAIVSSALTMAYYAWMIPAWIHSDDVVTNKAKSPRFVDDEDFATPDYKDRGSRQSKTFNASTFRFADLEGDTPPNYAYFIKEPIYRRDSVLKVNTSKDASYVIKIVDPYDGEVIMMCYLPAGISQEIDVPSGTFEIRYTSGTEWFGDDEMFGAKGSYAKANRLFSFSEGSGYELTLYRVPNGNLHTSRMKKEDF